MIFVLKRQPCLEVAYRRQKINDTIEEIRLTDWRNVPNSMYQWCLSTTGNVFIQGGRAPRKWGYKLLFLNQWSLKTSLLSRHLRPDNNPLKKLVIKNAKNINTDILLFITFFWKFCLFYSLQEWTETEVSKIQGAI